MSDLVTLGFGGNGPNLATLGFGRVAPPVVIVPGEQHPDPYHATWIDDNRANPQQAVILA